MLGALIYLRLMSLWNWVRWRVRRLRQPKYLAGAVVGFAYLYFFFFRHIAGVRQPGIPPPLFRGHAAVAAVPLDWLPIAYAAGTVLLLVVFLFAWIVPTQRAALGFSEAEIAFLFPAPVTRRALVHFRLITAQLRSLAAGLVMALLSNRWSMTGGTAVTHTLGWWFVFSTLNLHFTAAHFTLTRLADHGVAVWVRRAAALMALVAVVAFTLGRLPPNGRVPLGPGGAGGPGFAEWLLSLTGTAPLAWVLYPLRLVLGPFFAPDFRRFLVALGPGLLVIAAHYLWVVRAVASFEDASIAQAGRKGARVAAWRSGEGRGLVRASRGRAAPFRLAGAGRPELAFLWKNLLSTWPYFNLRVFGVAAGIIVAASVWLKMQPRFSAFGAGAGWMAAVAAGYLLLLGPQFARQDMRGDLRKLDVLKTYPLPGWQIVLGELLTPAAILTGLVWLALLVFFLNLEITEAEAWLTPGMRVATGVGLATLVPPVVLLQLLVPNAAVLVFPGWFEATRMRGGGPEVMGQRMIFLFAQVITIVTVLLPAVIMGAAVLLLAQFFVGVPLAFCVAAIPVMAVLLGEVAAGLWWLGRRFETINVAEALRG